MVFVDKLLEYVAMGGYVMPPLILGTLALWFGLGYRASATRRGRRRLSGSRC